MPLNPIHYPRGFRRINIANTEVRCIPLHHSRSLSDPEKDVTTGFYKRQHKDKQHYHYKQISEREVVHLTRSLKANPLAHLPVLLLLLLYLLG